MKARRARVLSLMAPCKDLAAVWSLMLLCGSLAACGIETILGADDDRPASAEITGELEDLQPATVDAEVVGHVHDDDEIQEQLADRTPATADARVEVQIDE